MSEKEEKNDEHFCEECNAPLSENDEFQMEYKTCNSYCFGKMVGVYF